MSEYTIEDRHIKGEVQSIAPSVEQATSAEFLEVIDRALDIKGVKAIRWEQFTPYFNDGDPCEFGVGEVSVLLSKRFYAGEREEYGDYEDGFLDSWALKSWGPGGYSDPIYKINGQDTSEIYEALQSINSARFENVLKVNFGDPAQVTATKEGFEVEFYDHD